MASPETVTSGHRVRAQESGRELQDRIIRYLAEARLRRQPASDLPLTSVEAEKAGRFARFLARRYYRDRLIRSFRYARLLAPQTGRPPEAIVEAESFSRLLDACVLGSLETADRVATLVTAHLTGATVPGPWWADLLRYEAAFFRQMATSEHTPTSPVPRRGVSATLEQLAWDVPRILSHLKAGEQISDDAHRNVTLLFSRAREGKVYVVEPDAAMVAVFLATDGLGTAEQISAVTSLPPEETAKTLKALSQIGAVLLA